MKAVLFIWIPLTTAFVAFLAWYNWDWSRNRGFECGYYGDLNRVSHALTAIPGVTITRGWANPDITLEEFGFDIRTESGQMISLNFQETDPIRNLSRERLTRALMNEIQAKAALLNAKK